MAWAAALNVRRLLDLGLASANGTWTLRQA
jgi:hypothetical protein